MRRVAIPLLVCATLAWAAQPWKVGDPNQWSKADAERVLADSPWAQSSSATFALAEEYNRPPGPAIDIPEGGMAGSRGATDGKWDGGVGRAPGGPPVLNVTVRWESALPVRQALARLHETAAYPPEQSSRDYIITVAGLVPGGRYGTPQLNSRTGDGADDVRNPEEMIEGVMRYSRLLPRGNAAIRPENVKLDNSTGTLYLFFPRTQAVNLADKEILFETRFGSLSVLKKFRLKDMVYKGRLEL